MVVYTSILIVTCCVACMVRNHAVYEKKTYEGIHAGRLQYWNRACIALLFVLLFAVSASRYELGNDYKRYLEFFRLISKDQYVPTEIGFNAIVRLMQMIFGSETYLSIFALCAAFTIGLFLKALYDLSENFGMSFFLFFCFGYYFYSMNSVRYYMAVALVMVSMQFVIKGQIGKFVSLVVIAALFHKSALIAIVVYLLAVGSYRRWQYGLLIAGMASALVLKDIYLKIILWLYPTYVNTELLEGGTSVINIFRCAAVLFLGLLYYKDAIADCVQTRFYFHLNLLAFLLYTCCSFLPEISRIGYYMTVGHVFLIPMIISRIPDRRQKKVWTVLIVAASLVYFAAFLYRAYDPLIKLLPYKTWFFEPKPRFEEFGA